MISKDVLFLFYPVLLEVGLFILALQQRLQIMDAIFPFNYLLLANFQMWCL